MIDTVLNLVMGLPASGKSTYATDMAKSFGAVLIDDPKDFCSDVIFKIKPGMVHYIVDCHLCLPRVRRNAEVRLAWDVPMVKIQHIYFANDPEQCLRNLAARMAAGDPRTAEDMIKYLAPLYEIPEGASVKPVWRPT